MNDLNVKCNIDRSEGDEYRISYTPTVRGHHELTVTVNDQEVAGSPFPVLISIHPSKLGKPVKIIPGHGNLYVSVINKNPCIQVLSDGGEVLHSFGEKELMECA